MSQDLDPCRSTIDLENLKFALDSNGNVVVRVIDDDAIDVLNQILAASGGDPGTPFYDETQTTTTGSLQTLISVSVPVGTTRSITKVVISCRKSGKYNVKINSTIVGSGRTGPSEMNSVFRFLPSRPASAGDTISVEFEQLSGPSTDVEAYLMANDMT